MNNLFITKTIGKLNEAGAKDYQIQLSDGRRFLAVRDGLKFICEGQRGTIKQIKNYLLSSEGDEAALENDHDTKQKPYEESCVHPCAFLVRFINHGAIHLSSELSKTLNDYGYMGQDGNAIDNEAANKEFSRVARFRNFIYDSNDDN